jgi:hypothetical protein
VLDDDLSPDGAELGVAAGALSPDEGDEDSVLVSLDDEVDDDDEEVFRLSVL